MKYGKIICGALQVPQNYPCSIELEGQIIHNPTAEQYAAAGYLPIEESEPEEREGKVPIATYKLNKAKTKIIQIWQYSDEPEEHVENNLPEPPAEEPAPKEEQTTEE